MKTSILSLLTSSGVIAKRAAIGATYIAINMLVLMIGPEFEAARIKTTLPIVPLVVAASIIIAHIGYEAVLSVQRRLSITPVLVGFREVTSTPKAAAEVDYNFLRVWRRTFLSSRAPAALKKEIEKNMYLRQTLSYLVGSAVLWLTLVFVLHMLFEALRSIARVEAAMSVLIILATSVAHRNRSHALGRSYGNAYNHSAQRHQVDNIA